MSDLKIDHSKKDLFEAIGIGQKGKEDLCEKQATIATKLVTGEFEGIGQIAEEIAKSYSYPELVAAATNELVTKTAESMSKNPMMLMSAIINKFTSKDQTP